MLLSHFSSSVKIYIVIQFPNYCIWALKELSTGHVIVKLVDQKQKFKFLYTVEHNFFRRPVQNYTNKRLFFKPNVLGSLAPMVESYPAREVKRYTVTVALFNEAKLGLLVTLNFVT